MSDRLEAKRLAKRFGKHQAVRDVSLSVAPGEIVGLLGPNGAGKTTSFYMIVGLVRADAGEIRMNGHDITRRPVHLRARDGLGYLPQEASVFRKLSVEDNIRAVLEVRQDLDRAGRRRLLEQLLEELGVGHVRTSAGLSLSGGERRRVEIARALAAEPRYMLLDEPFAGVDPISVSEIQRIVRQLSERGIGVLVTDHNVRETLGICQRSYIISEGTVIADGTAEELVSHRRVREVYLGADFRL